MRNKVVKAMMDSLVIPGLAILGPAYADVLDVQDDHLLKLFINQFPLACVDFRSEGRERKSGGFVKKFRGRIIAAVLNIDLEQAEDELAKIVSGEGYILDKLFTIPTPVVDDIHLRFTIHETIPGNYALTEAKEIYITENIPVDIEVWK